MGTWRFMGSYKWGYKQGNYTYNLYLSFQVQGHRVRLAPKASMSTSCAPTRRANASVAQLVSFGFLQGLQGLPVTEKTYLFKDLYIETIIRNPKKVGLSDYR